MMSTELIEGQKREMRATINLVDLAGSERAAKTGATVRTLYYPPPVSLTQNSQSKSKYILFCYNLHAPPSTWWTWPLQEIRSLQRFVNEAVFISMPSPSGMPTLLQ